MAVILGWRMKEGKFPAGFMPKKAALARSQPMRILPCGKSGGTRRFWPLL
jgi:hypothetical protein